MYWLFTICIFEFSQQLTFLTISPQFVSEPLTQTNLLRKCWGRVVPEQNVHEGNVKKGKNKKKLNLHTYSTVSTLYLVNHSDNPPPQGSTADWRCINMCTNVSANNVQIADCCRKPIKTPSYLHSPLPPPSPSMVIKYALKAHTSCVFLIHTVLPHANFTVWFLAF